MHHAAVVPMSAATIQPIKSEIVLASANKPALNKDLEESIDTETEDVRQEDVVKTSNKRIGEKEAEAQVDNIRTKDVLENKEKALLLHDDSKPQALDKKQHIVSSKKVGNLTVVTPKATEKTDSTISTSSTMDSTTNAAKQLLIPSDSAKLLVTKEKKDRKPLDTQDGVASKKPEVCLEQVAPVKLGAEPTSGVQTLSNQNDTIAETKTPLVGKLQSERDEISSTSMLPKSPTKCMKLEQKENSHDLSTCSAGKTLERHHRQSRKSSSSESGSARSTSSAYRGVCWLKDRRSWRSRIEIQGKREHLGYFNTERKAALAYDMRAIEHYGMAAGHLNFPDEARSTLKLLHMQTKSKAKQPRQRKRSFSGSNTNCGNQYQDPLLAKQKKTRSLKEVGTHSTLIQCQESSEGNRVLSRGSSFSLPPHYNQNLLPMYISTVSAPFLSNATQTYVPGQHLSTPWPDVQANNSFDNVMGSFQMNSSRQLLRHQRENIGMTTIAKGSSEKSYILIQSSGADTVNNTLYPTATTKAAYRYAISNPVVGMGIEPSIPLRFAGGIPQHPPVNRSQQTSSHRQVVSQRVESKDQTKMPYQMLGMQQRDHLLGHHRTGIAVNSQINTTPHMHNFETQNQWCAQSRIGQTINHQQHSNNLNQVHQTDRVNPIPSNTVFKLIGQPSVSQAIKEVTVAQVPRNQFGASSSYKVSNLTQQLPYQIHMGNAIDSKQFSALNIQPGQNFTSLLSKVPSVKSEVVHQPLSAFRSNANFSTSPTAPPLQQSVQSNPLPRQNATSFRGPVDCTSNPTWPLGSDQQCPQEPFSRISGTSA